jgi:hypothetical protein
MQPSEQQPQSIDENEQHSTDEEVEKLPDEPLPLYEFPPESLPSPELVSPNSALQTGQMAIPLPETTSETGNTVRTTPGTEAGPQGFVYPPPPSFYQNMSPTGEVPPLPSMPAQGQAGQLAYSPLPAHFQSPPIAGMYAPPGAPPFQPPNMQPPAPTQKRSRKWVWILVSVAAVILLASCGLCGWGFYSIFSSAFQGVSGSLNVVNDYFSNLQNRNYAAAYNDLSIHNLSEAQFAQQAAQIYNQDGAILSYTPNQPSFSTNPNSGPNLSQFNVAVNVKRQKLSYTVFLTLNQVHGAWKITYYDRL